MCSDNPCDAIFDVAAAFGVREWVGISTIAAIADAQGIGAKEAYDLLKGWGHIGVMQIDSKNKCVQLLMQP